MRRHSSSLTTLSVCATVPPACPILSPRPLPALLVRAPHLALYQLAEAIGDRPLACVTAVQIKAAPAARQRPASGLKRPRPGARRATCYRPRYLNIQRLN
jgi:hypothetical protein